MNPFIPKSIKWRLQVWHGLILLLVLGGFGVTAFQLQRTNVWRRIDADLQGRVGRIASEMRAGGPPPRRGDFPPEDRGGPEDFPGPPEDRPHPRPPRDLRLPGELAGPYQTTNYPGYYFVLWLRDGTLLSKSAHAPENPQKTERVSGEEITAIRKRDGFREAYHFTKPGECILVGRSVVLEEAELQRLAWVLTAVGGAILALGLLGGWWLAERAIRPIENIAATASRISAGNLAERIEVTETETELGQLAGVLNSAFERLDAAFAQQRQFTADASHELRTPLTVILTQTQAALSRERSAPEYRESLEACQRAAQRMRRMAESLLELARLDGGQESLERSNIDLSTVARETVEMLAPLGKEKGLELKTSLEPAMVSGDRELLGRVIANLVTNAIHYNREKGEVRIATRKEQGRVVLTVADTGIGMAPDDLEHIFERFYRADRSRSRAGGHCGLGLAICKAIIDSHGGTISATSNPGVGSEFVVRL